MTSTNRKWVGLERLVSFCKLFGFPALKSTTMTKLLLPGLVLTFCISSNTQAQSDTYDVYAIRFAGKFRMPVKEIAVGVTAADTVTGCYMIWLLKGTNGRNILVDAGFTDSTRVKNGGFIRPDRALNKVNLSAPDITDVIITHPHWDHIGGVTLFPNANVWMQKDDYDYFVGMAWQENSIRAGLSKFHVKKIVDINLDGKLKLVKGDNQEIIPGVKVFTGSRHTFESQYVLVNTAAGKKVIIASDNVWFYYNLKNLVSIPTTFDQAAYVQAMKRMKTLATREDLIIPGHDMTVFELFRKVKEDVVKIGD
jgi:glyoxylase-like metal-dependent hydrolase (beta-lactamase superfamily II)